jgi:hypothetical protein
MVKQNQRGIERQSTVLALKPQSMSIQKPITLRSAKKAPASPSLKCLTTSASTASLGQCEGDKYTLFSNFEINEAEE